MEATGFIHGILSPNWFTGSAPFANCLPFLAANTPSSHGATDAAAAFRGALHS
jgi:hypothetical protein